MSLRQERLNNENQYIVERWTDYYEHFDRVVQLCEHLPGWEVKEQEREENRDDYPPYEIQVAGSGDLALYVKAENGRYVITGSYPRHTNGQYAGYRVATPRITVGASRPLDKIAADILRRFIPDYEKAVEGCLAEIKEQDAFNNAQDATLKGLSGILGATPSTHSPTTISVYRNGLGVKVQVHSAQSIEIEVGSVSRVRAENLCRLIMEECFQ